MKISFLIRTARPLILLAVLSGFAAARAADVPAATDVLTPTKRQEVVDQAAKLLASREVPAITSDPFHPAGFEGLIAESGRPAGTTIGTTPREGTPTQPAGPRTEREILVALATALKSPNVMFVGGQPVLFFGQKRVKAGGTLTITFEGSQYTVEITTIAPPNFTLRLNREEFTRTIK
jgi:hypothetical protein